MKLYVLVCLFCAARCFAKYIPPGPKFKCPASQTIIFPCNCVKSSDVGLYVECENSNLAILSVALRNLASLLLPIEELLLKKCKFETLYGSIFHKLSVRIMKIVDTPIKIIDDQYIFYGINNSLQEFHLINSNLSYFPKIPFQVLGNLSVLNIESHQIPALSPDEFVNSFLPSRLEKLTLSNGILYTISIETFQHLKKLKSLDLHGNNLTTLKKNQFKGLREVEILDISFNKIEKLDSSHIADLTKLGWCNVSHNDLSELIRGTFARNSVLKVLNMSFNKIMRLDSNSFRGMRFLRRLYLSDNLIADISRSTFGSITRIGTIDLARNGLKKIDYQMFYQLNYVEIIDLSENFITEIQKQAFTDLYLAKINISHNLVNTIEENAFINCVNMSVLDLGHNLIEDMPKNAFDSNTYATVFQLSFNKLTNLSQVPLHNMTGLKILNVSHNSIVDIPKKTFPKLYELHTVDLSHNNLSMISNGVFQTLFSLRFLNLSFNQLDKIKPSTFGSLTTLLEIDLSNNILTDVAKGSLASLSSANYINLENNMLENMFQIPISLSHLNLRRNWIMNIPEQTWPVMNALLKLNLGKNRLSDNLRNGAFAGLLTLQTLYLNDNGMKFIPKQSLANMNTLQYLHLQNNNITNLGKSAFGNLPIVFELHLYNNNINTISPRAFEGLLQLLVLNLSTNELKYVHNEAFYGLVSLRKIDLSYNSIEKLDNKTNGLLDDCLSLENINLSHNKISFLTRKSFPSSPYIPYNLKSIDLSYNQMPTLTYDITFGTKNVVYLNVSHNNLNDIRKAVIGNLTSIEVLDLSFNDLSNLQVVDIFALPKTLQQLFLQNNNIQKFPSEAIENLTNLHLLDLRNNKLTTFNDSLVKKIKYGMKVFFEGNDGVPCDCKLRPLVNYLKTLTEPPSYYSNLVCMADRVHILNDIEDKHLSCLENNNTYDERFLLQPDIKFRKIWYKKNRGLYLEYFVTTREDVADFYISIKKDSNIIWERHLSYDSRFVEIDSPAIRNEKNLLLCVLAKNSIGNILRWFDTQCITISTEGEFELQQGKSTSVGNGVGAAVIQTKNNTKLISITCFLQLIIILPLWQLTQLG